MKLRDINKKEFEDFCIGKECDNFFQSKYYAELNRLDGYYTYFVGLEENGRILACTMLLSKNISIFKKREFYAPRGFIIDYKNLNLIKVFTEKLVEYIKQKNGILIKINPIVSLHGRDSEGNIIEGGTNNVRIVENLKELGWIQDSCELLYPVEDNFLYEIELKDKTKNDIFENFNDTLKDTINNNELLGISTRKLDKQKIQKIVDILDSSSLVIDHLNMNHGNYKEIINILDNHNMLDITIAELDIDKYSNYLQTKLENYLDEKDIINKKINEVKTLQYEYGHKIIIGLILGVAYHNNYYVLIHAANEVDKDIKPFETLYWETIKQSIDFGYDKYNFCEIGNNQDSYLLKVLHNFNGKVIELIGEFNYVLDNHYYKKCMKKQKKKERNLR